MNIGIIGTGWIAEKTAETIGKMSAAGEDVTLLAAASRDLLTAEKFAARNGALRAYGGYDRLYADDEIDLVYVATPHNLHYENMTAALNAGRGVLCEKPFTVNAAQARSVLALAAKKELFIAEAMWTRYMPIREKFSLINEIGTPQSLTADLAYANAHIRRMYDLELAGGALLDLGVYAINFAVMAFGDDIAEIKAECEKFPTGADMSDDITLTYRGGKTARLTASFKETRDSYGVIKGTDGELVFKNINNFEWVELRGKNGVTRYERPEQFTGYEYQIRACGYAIKNGLTEPREFKHAEIIRVMEITDGIRGQFGLKYPCESL